MYNNKLISRIFKYYKFDVKDSSSFTTLTSSNFNNTIHNNSYITSTNTNSKNKDSNTTVNTNSIIGYYTNKGNIRKELDRLESTENIVNDIDTLHRLITSNMFAYDDRVQKALKELSLLRNQISDYETLLKAIEIFYKTNNKEIMMAILTHFSKDIPYLPNNALLQLTKYFTKSFKDNDIVQSLQSQLYSNIIYTMGKMYKQEQEWEPKQLELEEKPEPKIGTRGKNHDKKVDISSSDIESILYCTNIIKDQRLVYNTLKSIDFSRKFDFKELLNILKLYNILVSSGNIKIEGFMTKFLDNFNNLLRNISNNNYITISRSDNTSSNIFNNDRNNNDLITNYLGNYNHNLVDHLGYIDQKDIINCYRMLIKIRSHEGFDIVTTSNIINDKCYYSYKDLVLVLKDLYYSNFKIDDNISIPIIKGIFDTITQLTKDDVILLVRYINKNKNGNQILDLKEKNVKNNNNSNIDNNNKENYNGIKLSKYQDELVNFQVLLHTSYYDSNDILSLLNYYTNRNNKEDINIVVKLYDHLNSFIGIGDNSNCINGNISNSLSTTSNIFNNDRNNNDSITDVSLINVNNRTERNDINTNLYSLSKFILYFKEKDTLNGLMVRRYVRTLNRNYLSLNNKVISYSLYVFYKIGYNPQKLLNNLLPILHNNLERYNSVDLTQMLLFFNLFRLRYEHFNQVLVDKVYSKLLDNEFNDQQLVIISKCLYDYKKTFTSSLFNTISSRLDYMSIPQICTAFNSYVKSGLNNQLVINNINEIVLKNLEKLKYNDVIKLLVPIKKGYIQESSIIDYIKNNYELETGDIFDVFGVVPKDYDIDEQQVIKCTISLARKERNVENDRFARNLFTKMFKIVPRLSEKESSLLLNSILAYGYIKPKINRLLTNRLQKYNITKINVEKEKKEDKSLEVFKFFRHISKGPPHLDKVKNC